MRSRVEQLDGLIVIEVVGEIERAESKLAARFSRRRRRRRAVTAANGSQRSSDSTA